MQVGLDSGQRQAALRPDIPFTVIENSRMVPELEQPEAVIKVIRDSVERKRSAL